MLRKSYLRVVRFGLLLTVLAWCRTPRAESASPAGSAASPAAESPPPVAPDPDAARKEEAKQRFLRGLDLARTQDWDAALVEFLASREIFPTRVAVTNAASALTTLKRYAEALDMYRELLTRFGATLTPEQKKTAEDAMAQLAARVGEISIERAVPGTRVVVDGQERGVAPLAPVAVNAGTHSVRAFREGFLPFEGQVMVAGGKRTSVPVQLQPMTRSGQLRVAESTGASYDVVVDGIVVGKTPWEGTQPLGAHTVLLRGPDHMGTPPSGAEIEEGRTATLTLTSVLLDATLRVEPTPSNARVFVDGVYVGTGVWEGAVQMGARRVEVSAQGFIADKRNIRAQSNKREVVTMSLDRDPNDPMWAAVFRSHIFLTAAVGLFVSPSFGGSADDACSSCGKAPPFGFTGGIRGGYQATSGLGIEVMVGYLDIKGSMKRPQTADGDDHVRSLTTNDFYDATRLSGPLAMLSASYTFFDQTPLTVRLAGGAARMTARFQGHGVFNGVSVNPNDKTERGNFKLNFDLAEQNENIWVPMLGPEVRIGYRISKRFIVDFGVAAFVMFAPETPRVAEDGGPRAIPFGQSPGKYPSGTPIPQPGQVTLPSEHGFGTMIGFAPTIGGRVDF